MKVEVPRQAYVLDADLEHGWIHEGGVAQHDGRAANGPAQRTECAGLVDAERPEFLNVVRLAHQAHSPAETDDFLLLFQSAGFSTGGGNRTSRLRA